MRTVTLYFTARYDDRDGKIDDEDVSGALSTLLSTAASTPGVLDKIGEVELSSVEVLKDEQGSSDK